MPADKVLATAKETGAIPYDIPGVKFSHVGEKCSFDAFIAEYKLDAPGLDKLADIVRGADTSRLDLTPQSAGLFAISLGLSHVLSGRPRDAEARHGDVRRALRVVPQPRRARRTTGRPRWAEPP